MISYNPFDHMKNYKDYQVVLQVTSCDVIRKKPVRHSKRSYLGCHSCKQKKIKCDETKIRCNNCRRSNLQCTWPNQTIKRRQNKRIGKTTGQNKQNLGPSSGDTDTTGNSISDPSKYTPSIALTTLISYPNLPQTLLILPPPPPLQLDSFFFSRFANKFLPTIARPHFHQRISTLSLILSASSESSMLREIFIACGATLVASENDHLRAVARKRYFKALSLFLKEMKLGGVDGREDWLFVAVQVLQTLCLRDTLDGSNATRCASHFSAAYKIIIRRLLGEPTDLFSIESRGILVLSTGFSPLERVMIENFIFNYSLTIFFCEHDKLEALIPNPFQFFAISSDKLLAMSLEDGTPRCSRMSLLAFQIAAKCLWLCRLKLPLSPHEKLLHVELLQFAGGCLYMLDSMDTRDSVRVKNTVSIAKVVLRTSILLLRKMLDIDLRALHLQGTVRAIMEDMREPCNDHIIYPIWSLMICASTALDSKLREYFREKLEKLLHMSNSSIVKQICNHLDGLWEIYDGDEPFQLLFDTEVLDQVCN